MEGYTVNGLASGTSSAKKSTVSFYVKGNASATYVVELIKAGDRHINKTFSVTTSWSRVSITFDGDTTTQLAQDNTQELSVNIWLHAGSNFTSGTLQTSWGAYTAANRAVGISSFFDSTDRELFITGWQYELGEVATPYKHESYGDNLARCQRYFYAPVPKGSANSYFGTGFNYNSSLMLGFLHHPVEMRANPTLTSSDGTDDFGFLRNGAEDTFNDVGLNSTNTKGTSIINNSDISGTGGQAGGLYINDTTNALIYLSAEL
jgi:hypothetical protein